MNTIGKRFREEIKRQGYTLERFCAVAGISSKGVLSGMLSKKDEYWTYTKIKAFCDVLRISVDSVVRNVKS